MMLNKIAEYFESKVVFYGAKVSPVKKVLDVKNDRPSVIDYKRENTCEEEKKKYDEKKEEKQQTFTLSGKKQLTDLQKRILSEPRMECLEAELRAGENLDLYA